MVRSGPDPAQLRQFIAQLRPGAVVRLHQPVADKVKRHVLISAAAERSLAFIINTLPSPFILAREELKRRQVLMLKADHSFMHHDSYVACHDTVRLPAARDFAGLLWAGKAQILGNLHASLYEAIAAAANGSPLIADRDVRLIVAGFSRTQGTR